MEATGAAKYAGDDVCLSVVDSLAQTDAFIEMELGFSSLIPCQTNVFRLVEEGVLAAGRVYPTVFVQGTVWLLSGCGPRAQSSFTCWVPLGNETFPRLLPVLSRSQPPATADLPKPAAWPGAAGWLSCTA